METNIEFNLDEMMMITSKIRCDADMDIVRYIHDDTNALILMKTLSSWVDIRPLLRELRK